MWIVLAKDDGKILDEIVEHLLLCWRHVLAIPTTSDVETRTTEEARNIVLDRFEVGGR